MMSDVIKIYGGEDLWGYVFIGSDQRRIINSSWLSLYQVSYVSEELPFESKIKESFGVFELSVTIENETINILTFSHPDQVSIVSVHRAILKGEVIGFIIKYNHTVDEGS